MNEIKRARSHFGVPPVNVAIVRGVLASDPTARELPSGSVVHNYDITAIGWTGKRMSVPVAWVDPARPPGVRAGDEVVAVGSVRRRFFRVGGSTQSRTEVLAEVVTRPSSPRVTRTLERALADFGE